MVRKKVSFWAIKRVPKRVNVSFRDKYGRRVSFRATKKVSAPVKVKFYIKKRRGK